MTLPRNLLAWALAGAAAAYLLGSRRGRKLPRLVKGAALGAGASFVVPALAAAGARR